MPEQELRIDRKTEANIRHGLALRRTVGEATALRFLNVAGVAPHLVERVWNGKLTERRRF